MTPNASPETLGVGWIEWSGGENPVPGQKVDVLFRTGVRRADYSSDAWTWTYGTNLTDIIAYRVVETPVPNTEGMKATSGRNEPKADKSQTDMGERVAELEAGLAKLLSNLDALDDYMKQPERGGHGVECAVCMNEWLEPEDRADMEAARALLNPKLEG